MALSKILNASVTDSTLTTTKLATPNLGRRNLVINGAMQVAQRNTSVSSISSGDTYHTVDRFMTRVGTAGTWTQTQETLAVTDPPFIQDGHTKALKMDCTTANSSLSAGSYIIVNYRIEGQDMQQFRSGTSNSAPMTISFWVKATKTGTNVLTTYQDEGGKQVSLAYTINSSNTWEHKTLTIPGNAHNAIDNDNTRGRQISWNLALGSNRTSGSLQSTWQAYSTGDEGPGQVNHADSTSNNFHLTGIQIEVGSQATPFEHRSFGEELDLCHRYYEKTNWGYILGGRYNQDTGVPTATWFYKKDMRASPSISNSGTWTSTAGWGGAPLPIAISDSHVSVYSATHISASQNIWFNGGALIQDAEL